MPRGEIGGESGRPGRGPVSDREADHPPHALGGLGASRGAASHTESESCLQHAIALADVFSVGKYPQTNEVFKAAQRKYLVKVCCVPPISFMYTVALTAPLQFMVKGRINLLLRRDFFA